MRHACKGDGMFADPKRSSVLWHVVTCHRHLHACRRDSCSSHMALFVTLF
jgi:hypothetical protein